MPMTTWEEIAGYRCAECGSAATHFYGNAAICCVCHCDGDESEAPISRDEAEAMHEEILDQRQSDVTKWEKES